jgi:hypothetical protein
MYFWKIENLKKDLREKGLSEKEGFYYLFVTILLYTIALTPYEKTSIWDMYNTVSMVLISAVGLIYLYKKNGGNTGHNFLQRYFSLGWVYAIRWVVFWLIPGTIVYGLFYHSINPGVGAIGTKPSDVLFGALLYSIYFFFLGKHIKEVASSK